eukprot:TRINITY_DN9726_c1_g1_i1.p1 TRINITY_DN9726_c1_g1~~TRINITY_DN9726_c1_g1_i1.p1  ORF type:complete len:503 (+),score=239.83 TRINITY_DN9726_c1_g1_i1:83-1591(+)
MLRTFLAGLALVSAVHGKDDPKLKKHIKAADELIMKGRSHYNEAAASLSRALEEFPNDEKVLNKRAEVNEMLKNYNAALADLKTVLEHNEASKVAYQLRTKIAVKTGDFALAAQDYRVLMGIYQTSKSKHEKGKKYEAAKAALEKYHQFAHELSWIESELEKQPESKPHLRKCVEIMQRLTKEAKDTDKFRLRLIECAMAAGDHDAANEELSRVLILEPQNLDAMHLKALSLKGMGATDAAIQNLKRCLGLDPEFKKCMELHKSIKKYEKIVKRFEEAVERSQWDSVLTIVDESFVQDANPHNLDRLMLHRCKAHEQKGMSVEGKESCTAAIDSAGTENPATWEMLVLRANILMMLGELDEADADLKRAGELNQNSRTVREAQARLEKKRKMAARKDYYKILGVDQKATEKEIKKAYRKLAMIHHPDKVDKSEMSEEEVEQAMQLFRDMSDGYQILSDAEKRRRYDLGEDIEDQPQQQHPFQRGGHPFGGGGGGGNFHFKFR